MLLHLFRRPAFLRGRLFLEGVPFSSFSPFAPFAPFSPFVPFFSNFHWGGFGVATVGLGWLGMALGWVGSAWSGLGWPGVALVWGGWGRREDLSCMRIAWAT